MIAPILVALPQLSTELESYRFGGPGDRMGAAVAMAGDWDGDGVEDYAVGAPFEDLPLVFNTLEQHGRIRIHSGASGDEIAATGVVLNQEFVFLGFTLAGGFDTDADGLPEIAASVAGIEEVLILEQGAPGGAGLAVIASFAAEDSDGIDEIGFGEVLENVGDLTGDGVDDLAIGAPRSDRKPSLFVDVIEQAGSLRLVSGATWTTVNKWSFGGSGARFGSAVAGVGDMNGNGGRDLAVGAPGVIDGGDETAGTVYFLDLKLLFSSPVVLELAAPEVGTGFGAGLADAGDVLGGPKSELLIAAANPRGNLSVFGTEVIFEALIDRGTLALYDLDTLLPLWERGGVEGFQLDARQVALGDPDGDGVPEAVVVEAAGESRGAALITLDVLSGTIEARFDATAGLGLESEADAAVGPDFNGDGRPDIVFGTELLEFGAGGVFGVSLSPTAAPSTPRLWHVDDDGGPGVDFVGLSQAAMVARAGDRVRVAAGGYDYAGSGKPLTIFGVPPSSPSVKCIDLRGAGAGRLERLDPTLLRLGGNSGRVTVDLVSARQVVITDSDDVTLLACVAGPAAPGIEVRGSRVELIRSSASADHFESAIDDGVGAALRIRDGSNVLLADSAFTGASGVTGSTAPAPVEAIRVSGSDLDLRGGPLSAIFGGLDPANPPSTAPGVTVADGVVVVSAGHPAVEVVELSGGFETADGVARPWLVYAGSSGLGGTWTVSAFGEAGAPGLLGLSLGSAALPLPQVVNNLTWIDAGQLIDSTPFVGSGSLVPFERVYPIPDDPAIDGLELHVQAFVARPTQSTFDGSNGGAVQLRQ